MADRRTRTTRRLLRVLALFAATFTALLLSPLLLLVALGWELARPRRGIAPRLVLFGLAYLVLESLGVLAAFAIALLPGNRARFLERNYALQRWWSGAMFRAAQRTLSLKLVVEGSEAVHGRPFVLLMRHASLVDVLLPAVLVANPTKRRLRYVLKRELLADPCLDIVGNRIPNCFLDRANVGEEDLAALRALATDLEADEGVMIYPEGTFFTDARRERELAKLEESGSPHLPQARALRRTLPPRIGGVHALLDAGPELDVVVCAHRGLGGFARVGDIAKGGIVGATIEARLWRVPRASIPEGREARLAWLYAQWDEVDRFAADEVALELGPLTRAERTRPARKTA